MPIPRVNRLTYAILAALLVWAAPGIGPRGDVDPARRVRFQLADGVRVVGDLTSWDEDGFDGSFGRREWVELSRDDVWRLHVAIMDPEIGSHWVNLGRILLIVEGGEQAAERAFRRAERADPEGAAGAIELARESAAESRREREALAQRIEQQRLKTHSPEGEVWGATPWPTQTAGERAEAVETMKSDAAGILESAGMEIAPVESRYFLLYTDMPRSEAAIWARELDNMYGKLAKIFALESDENIFWGKAVIFVFTDRDRFRLVEAEAFGQLAPNWVQGMCHPRGPKVFVNTFRNEDDYDFAALLVHETVHGFMHRYKTPRRLPTWANEGFSDYLAAITFEKSPMDLMRRMQALRYIRKGGSVPAVLDMSYTDGTWPGEDAIGYAVGYLLVHLMAEDRPRAFGAWVKAIKAGKDWELALTEDFGVPRDQLVDTFVRFYMVND